MDHPTFVRIEYWSSTKGEWSVGHAGINLMNPSKYVQKLMTRGIVARAVNPDTGEVVYGEGADLL